MRIKTPWGTYQGIGKALRQLLPTKFATCYGAHTGAAIDTGIIPTFATWWMWMGRSFKVNTTVVPYQ